MSGLLKTRERVKYILIALCLAVLLGYQVKERLFPTPLEATNYLRVVSYNVENLYDTEDNPNTQDDDHTPSGKLHWTKSRLNEKLNRISEVLLSIDDNSPAFVGLVEVENSKVINALLADTDLSDEGYKYTISKSKDFRGANVAFLYKSSLFNVLEEKVYRPNIGEDRNPRYSRDLLHVAGTIASGDTLDFFVCHFPSRSGGIKKSNPKRAKVAQMLKAKTDSLMNLRGNAHIIVMGDFNDTPLDRSMRNTLGAKSLDENPYSKALYNLFYQSEKDKDGGSYKFQGKWSYFDQFIVSGKLLNTESKLHIRNNEAYVFDVDFLLQNDRKYSGKKPHRTYAGWKYIDGYSDHLPIYIDIMTE